MISNHWVMKVKSIGGTIVTCAKGGSPHKHFLALGLVLIFLGIEWKMQIDTSKLVKLLIFTWDPIPCFIETIQSKFDIQRECCVWRAGSSMAMSLGSSTLFW